MTVKMRHIPIRMCVVCRETSAKTMLLRVVRRPEKDGGGLAVDPTGRANGRGAYVCGSADCIDKAVKQKRFERSLRAGSVSPALADELKALCSAATAATLPSSGASAMS